MAVIGQPLSRKIATMRRPRNIVSSWVFTISHPVPLELSVFPFRYFAPTKKVCRLTISCRAETGGERPPDSSPLRRALRAIGSARAGKPKIAGFSIPGVHRCAVLVDSACLHP